MSLYGYCKQRAETAGSMGDMFAERGQKNEAAFHNGRQIAFKEIAELELNGFFAAKSETKPVLPSADEGLFVNNPWTEYNSSDDGLGTIAAAVVVLVAGAVLLWCGWKYWDHIAAVAAQGAW